MSTDEGRVVAVRRSGGFAGLVHSGKVDLGSADPRAGELTDLVAHVDPAAVDEGEPRADGFVYDFDLCGSTCRVQEQGLTDELRRIAELVLS
ncbi:protealysin inhibitor emfourin [Nocardioides sp.]|uniref:protealysin inhibitor emfourin n=1 Tax=Nocardioides sp. TaxID=35761 RepID=UPI002C611AEE|nr:protealysin inhibitor emfourin [Nocardioides sp.]HVX55170.1 protealysin inhibitor emfourin [Nocardioides sp.]